MDWLNGWNSLARYPNWNRPMKLVLESVFVHAVVNTNMLKQGVLNTIIKQFFTIKELDVQLCSSSVV